MACAPPGFSFGGGGWPDNGCVRVLVQVVVTHDDDDDKARRLAEKLWQLRILDGERSASDVEAPILVVSQFTLYANMVKGPRPTWNAARAGIVGRAVGDQVCRGAEGALGAEVAMGVFGADMQVELVNDGPVTDLLEL